MVRTVILIGDTSRREFSRFATWMCEQTSLRIVGRFDTIEAMLCDCSVEAESADMTIVLQSWSDQYSRSAINQLVGRTLFRRLICCYGAWCESDGRNRDLWPDANRVPLRLAERVVEWELLRIRDGQPAVPPTSAKDEIFAYRLGEPEDWAPLPELLNQMAVVVGPDRILRYTIADLLKEFGLQSTCLPLVDGRLDIEETLDELMLGGVRFVVHDLDPWSPRVSDSVLQTQQRFPNAELIGVATMPDGGLRTEIEDLNLPFVVPKLDLDDSLKWHLHEITQQRVER